MALHATNSAENVKASLERYLYDALVTANSLTVHWEGGKDIDMANVDEWYQPRIMYGYNRYANYVTMDTKGWEKEALLNISIYLRKGSSENYHRLAELRDIVADYFQIGQTVVLKDMRGSGASVDSFIVRDILTDQQIPTGDQLYWQWNFTPVLVFIQQWSP